ncbi:unnamed protein product [Leptidea sinapis]|uniref:Uncharacterized protein n=1 Tax=Leptidea sinapis TaxID=189913 RepID=A0A5E4QG27_9NEOP|nr:unnamed protein product [Leptidea sinapis]
MTQRLSFLLYTYTCSFLCTFRIANHLQIEVPHPVIVPVLQPYPVRVPIPKPVPVPVVRELTVPIEKIVPYPVFKKVPYQIEKPVAVHVPVMKPYPVKVPQVRPLFHHTKSHDERDPDYDEDDDYLPRPENSRRIPTPKKTT